MRRPAANCCASGSGDAGSTLPVVALRLRSGVLLPLVLRDAGLFERGRSADPEATARLLDLLRARLGHEAVFGVLPVSEHRPERAFRIAEPGVAAALPVPWPRRAPGAPAVDAGRAAAARRTGKARWSPVRSASRPGWWDGHDVRRDYYVALSRAGVRLWIFRERPPGQRWFLHGVFG